jgi:tetratricopeptide (TPR) repeat protein
MQKAAERGMTERHVNFLIAIGVAFGTVGVAWLAVASRAADAPLRLCTGSLFSDKDSEIVACTAIIESPGASTESRAIAHYNRGMAFWGLGKQERALQDFSEAIRLKPDFADAFTNRGRIYLLKREYDRAIQDLDRAIELRSTEPFFVDFCNRGDAYFNKQNWDAAIRDYDRAIQLRPTFAAALYGRGAAKVRKGDSAGGKTDIDAAEKIMPGIAQSERFDGIFP